MSAKYLFIIFILLISGIGAMFMDIIIGVPPYIIWAWASLWAFMAGAISESDKYD